MPSRNFAKRIVKVLLVISILLIALVCCIGTELISTSLPGQFVCRMSTSINREQLLNYMKKSPEWFVFDSLNTICCQLRTHRIKGHPSVALTFFFYKEYDEGEQVKPTVKSSIFQEGCFNLRLTDSLNKIVEWGDCAQLQMYVFNVSKRKILTDILTRLGELRDVRELRNGGENDQLKNKVLISIKNGYVSGSVNMGSPGKLDLMYVCDQYPPERQIDNELIWGDETGRRFLFEIPARGFVPCKNSELGEGELILYFRPNTNTLISVELFRARVTDMKLR